jgi:hypothetical protein
MPHTEFRNGYIAGWQSIRAGEEPTAFPVVRLPDGQTPYRTGIALGVRDAVASLAKQAGTELSVDKWLDDALRRPLSP